MRKPDVSALTAAEAALLFAALCDRPAVLLAVSGGPDSVALLFLIARWRTDMPSGPKLFVATVDHGLRPESAAEAEAVARLAADRGLPHRTLVWDGDKPVTGVPAAAREARYRLLRDAAADCGATHLLTAHTQDDQAETVLMRLARGSGVAGLAGMARESDLGGVTLVRPLLGVPKARLVATLEDAGIGFADDPTNRDPAYLRPRLRALLPLLAEEGLDASGLARLARRMARANEALEKITNDAEVALAHPDGWDDTAFKVLPWDIRVRLLDRAIRRVGGKPDLAQVETLVDDLASSDTVTQTLAGALIRQRKNRLTVTRALPRKRF